MARGRGMYVWALPKWLHNCCCRNGTKITVAHTFACVKLSHIQYKVTFFIYFYDPAHSAYVRRLVAPDPFHPVPAIKSGQPLSLEATRNSLDLFLAFTLHAFCYTYNRFFRFRRNVRRDCAAQCPKMNEKTKNRASTHNF